MKEHATHRLRRSRQLRSRRRRHILRTMARAGLITSPTHIRRGETVWLHSPEMARAKGDIDGLARG